MFHGSSHVCLTKALGLQVPKGLGRELVRIYLCSICFCLLSNLHT